MARKNNTTTILIIVVCLIVAGFLLWYFYFNKKATPIEGFTSLAAGANDNTGMLLDDSYDLVKGADDEVPAPHFADLVSQNNYTENYISQPKTNEENLRPMERLHRVQGKALMPRVSTQVTPYNVDVANPTAHKYMVNTPRVTSALKSRYKDYSLGSFIRGDIPITYNPNIPLVSKTTQGRDDLRLDGLFTPYFSALYNKYTGKAYKNLVQHVAGAGQASGYGGASGGTIMDHY
jgi:hypothetical protein